MMPDKTLKQIDVLRHELKALRYILDNFHAGKLPPAALPPREDFLSAQAREIYDIILKAPGREAAEARIAEIRLDDVDVASFLRNWTERAAIYQEQTKKFWLYPWGETAPAPIVAPAAKK